MPFHSREKELELIALAQAGMRAERSTEGPTLARWELITIGQAARNELIEVNIGWIFKVAKNTLMFFKKRDNSDAWVGDATLGFIHAIEKFDASFGCRLTSYSAKWMFCYIQRAANGNPLTRKFKVENEMTSLHGFGGNIVEARPHDAFEAEHSDHIVDMMRVALSLLKPRSAEILIQRAKGKTLEEIGTEIGISKERVRQLEKRAKQDMKNFYIVRQLVA